MDKYSIRLACVGLMIGILTLSAAALGGAAQKSETAALPDRAVVTETEGHSPRREPPTEPSLPEQEPPSPTVEAFAPTYYVALRTDPTRITVGLTLCDPAGAPLQSVAPDGEGDAALGPLAPGRYCLMGDGESLGEFVLGENAALLIATGQLWEDGELLHLEPYRPAEVELRLRLRAPGEYSFSLEDGEGNLHYLELRVPGEAAPDLDGVYLRTVRFRGLPPGDSTLRFRGHAVAALTLEPGELAALELTF